MEIFGFKSFKNKTVLEFENHEITGIVGPNGCGKSNVVDALLWVMGESSPKQLRGESFSDVIFAGAGPEPSGNLAEVHLTLRPGRSGFPENYKKFSEIRISRRAFRDGRSEYFINQEDCLLRDIKEFFMNTGVGCRGFSLIEQTAIERLITAQPNQRRVIIEESAGISKFKNRKSESVRKLNLVSQNLQRLKDVLKLQETQLGQLSNQAKTAEKYRKLKKEIEIREQKIKQNERENIFRTYQKLKREQVFLKADKLEKTQKARDLEEKIKEKQAQIQTTKNQIEEGNSKISAIKQDIMNQTLEETRLRDRVGALELIENMKKESREQLKTRRLKASELVESIRGKQKDLKDREKALQSQLKEIQSFFKNKPDIEDLEDSLGRIRHQIDEALQTKKSAMADIESLRAQLDFIEREIGKLLEEKGSLQTQIQESIGEKDQLRGLLKKRENARWDLEQSLCLIEEKKQNLLDKKQNMETEANNMNQSISALQSKIEEMKKLISHFESISEGAGDLNKWKPGEFEPLFQNLKIDPQYISALGAVLGPSAQALIPKEETDIIPAVRRLKTGNKGKACFLSSLPFMPISADSRKKLRDYPAFICFLDEKVKWNIHTEPLKALLEQTAVVSDLPSAFDLKRQFPAFQFVTQDGDFVARDSFVYAGSVKQGAGLIEIHSQIEELSEKLMDQKTALKVKRMNLEALDKQLSHMQSEKQSWAEAFNQNFESLISAQKDLEHKERDILKLSESRKKNEQKIIHFEKEKQNLILKKSAGHKEIQKVGANLSLKETQWKKQLEEVRAFKAQNVIKIQKEQELLDNQSQQKNREREISLLLGLMDHIEGREKSAPQDNSDGKADGNGQQELQFIQKKKKELERQLIFCQDDYQQSRELKENQEKSIKEMESTVFQIKLEINNLQSEEEKKELEKTHIKAQFLENCQSRIEDYSPSPEKIPLEKLKAERDHYEKQLSRIREVNFLALEEYEKLSKENFFLNGQKEDMLNSKKEIMKVIAHVDKICSARFNDMLEEINKRFSQVFSVIFPGEQAKAQLILKEDSESQEEPGVDILIQPPGKKNQSVSLLSRGEKALAGICLVYSLFLVRPSPFCVIDEADAPLDDSNVIRFLSILKEMSRASQVIVITHNKHSMQACGKLYGVTMERPGVSQIVSVDMKAKDISAHLV